MHGHADYLLNENCDFLFYPSESYNVNEKRGSNHFNCPVVAYYGELIKKNDSRLNEKNFIDPFVDLNAPKHAIDSLYESLKDRGFSKKEIKAAFEAGVAAFNAYRNDVKEQGKHVIEEARKQGKTIIVVAGRPYHIDPEVNHGIDKLLDSLDVAVVSEDAIAFMDAPLKTQVLNQWTYHARLFDAAHYVASQPDMEMLHLVSFGCGVDAITTDEVRRILEEKDRLYTMIKIDEINNLGAVRIRIRSLLAAVEEKRRRAKQ